jgi:subtilisin family serine protease
MNDFYLDPQFAGIDGTGFAIAILDTAFDVDHPFFGPDIDGDDIADRIVHTFDFVNEETDVDAQFNSHGTNVASIAAGFEDGVYSGIARGANLVLLQVLPEVQPGGTFEDVEQGLQWVAANATDFNITAVNMSLGADNFGDPNDPVFDMIGINDEIAAIEAVGITVVSASGNNFFGEASVQGVAYPAADPNSLAVGATWDADVGPVEFANGAIDFTTDVDRITSFTQRHGQLLDTLAPGAITTGGAVGGGTIELAGTSMATAHVAGVAVLAQQIAIRNSGHTLRIDEMRQFLADTGVPIADTAPPQDDNVANTALIFPRLAAHDLLNAVFAATWITGDFDYSRVVDDADIDILYNAIFGRISTLAYHDLTMDGSVTQQDMDFLIHDVLNTLYGDANVDGFTDVPDLIQVLQAGKYLTGMEALWGEGDWDGNRLFDQLDLIKALEDGAFQPLFQQLFGPFANQLPLTVKVALLDAFLRLGRIFF